MDYNSSLLHPSFPVPFTFSLPSILDPSLYPPQNDAALRLGPHPREPAPKVTRRTYMQGGLPNPALCRRSRQRTRPCVQRQSMLVARKIRRGARSKTDFHNQDFQSKRYGKHFQNGSIVEISFPGVDPYGKLLPDRKAFWEIYFQNKVTMDFVFHSGTRSGKI